MPRSFTRNGRRAVVFNSVIIHVAQAPSSASCLAPRILPPHPARITLYSLPGAAAVPIGDTFRGHAPIGESGASSVEFSQSLGGFSSFQIFAWLYSAAPIRKLLPSLPKGKQFATRAVTLPPPGRSLNITGVPTGNTLGLRNPHPCGLTTRAIHFAANGRMRSRLVTLMGISTRTLVLRRVVLGVKTSMEEASVS